MDRGRRWLHSSDEAATSAAGPWQSGGVHTAEAHGGELAPSGAPCFSPFPTDVELVGELLGRFRIGRGRGWWRGRRLLSRRPEVIPTAAIYEMGGRNARGGVVPDPMLETHGPRWRSHPGCRLILLWSSSARLIRHNRHWRKGIHGGSSRAVQGMRLSSSRVEATGRWRGTHGRWPQHTGPWTAVASAERKRLMRSVHCRSRGR